MEARRVGPGQRAVRQAAGPRRLIRDARYADYDDRLGALHGKLLARTAAHGDDARCYDARCDESDVARCDDARCDDACCDDHDF